MPAVSIVSMASQGLLILQQKMAARHASGISKDQKTQGLGLT